VAAVAIVVLPLGRRSEARGEALLTRAASTNQTTRHARQLRVTTRSMSFVRPLVLPAWAAESEEVISNHFAAAHYDWRDPLNPRTYSDWRHQLEHRTTTVSQPGDRTTIIETTTEEGSLQDALLTLDSMLIPVSARFRFAGDDWVEISIVADSLAAPTHAAPAEPPPVRETSLSAIPPEH